MGVVRNKMKVCVVRKVGGWVVVRKRRKRCGVSNKRMRRG